MSITKEVFGNIDGNEVYLFKMQSASGICANITNYGGSIVNLLVPDKDGNLADVVIGYDTLEGYITGGSNHGALIGRYGNRIAKGKLTVGGKFYQLAINNGENHLHGGMVGYNKRVWDVKETKDGDQPSLTLTLLDEDGTENYPGTLNVTVTYTLTSDCGIEIDYHVTTDALTVVNLTNHAYFNLSGYDGGTILDHVVQLNAPHYTPVDSTLIPTGEIRPVAGTAFDFTAPKAIGKDVEADDQQLAFGGGYDHNFVLGEPNTPKCAAEVYDPKSGRVMKVYTDQPAVQLYIGNFLDGKETGKGGKPICYRTGFCLETQFSPDTPNQPNFPQCFLDVDETYKTTTKYTFSNK